MKWVPASPAEIGEVLDFLLPRENTCVGLTSRFYPGTSSGGSAQPVWPEENPFIGLLKNRGAIEAVVYISNRGLALPVFSEIGEAELADRGFPQFVKKRLRNIHTCIGTKSVVSKIEPGRINRKHRVLYYLMAQGETSRSLERFDSSIEIKKAGLDRLEDLFPLYAEYEKEEVLLVPQRFNEKFHRTLFQRNLSTQILYYALLEGRPVGTAGTNAIGFSWCQLGSVFTLPRYRQRGIGSLLVARLCREINRAGKKGCLFVKQDNPAARALYTGLGFQTLTEYQISYFSY